MYRATYLPMGERKPLVFSLAFLIALAESQSQYDCTFETGYCSWIQDTSDQFNWIRTQGTTRNQTTRPTVDHTLGNKSGWYILIETAVVQGTNSAARLISPQIPASSPYCLQFWYYMYGAHVDALTIYVHRGGNPDIPLWTKSQTQGSQWKYGQVQLSSFSYPVNIVFEAVRGPFFKGDIGIDDIRAVAGSCPTTSGLACDFEVGLCGWDQKTKDDFDWTLHSGQTATVNTGPSNDHTLGTSSGHYLYIETSSPHYLGQKAHLVSSLVTQTTPQCMLFFYSLNGDNVGALNIYIISGAELTSSDIPVWSKRHNLGEIWFPGQTTIQGSSSYRVVFEGVVGAGSLGDIAIDDIIVRNGSCHHQANNNFEHGLGLWTNPGVGDNFDWMLGQASMGATFSGPRIDHTLGTSEGHYLFIESSKPIQAEDTVWLQSPVMEPNVALCMSFWFIKNIDDTDVINVLMRPATPANKSSITVWSLKDSVPTGWMHGRIALYNRAPFYIIIEVIRGEDDHGVTALDDISFTESECMADPFYAGDAFSLPSIPQLATTTPVPSPCDCDFEEDFCEWVQDTSDDFDWTKSTGATSFQNTAPAFDHTLGNGTGYYLYIETSLPRRANDTARLLSPQLNISPHGACLRFWYIMYGPSVNSLNVYVQSNTNITKVWTRTGTQRNQWTFGEAPVISYYSYQIIIEATRGTTFLGEIAIDDISFSERPCTDADTAYFCGFEYKELCGFTQDKNDSFDWTWKRAGTVANFTGPIVDHTEGTDAGHYMCIKSSAPRYPGERALLISPIYPQTTGSCLSFYYSMCGSRMGTLTVYLAETGPTIPYQIIFHKSGNQGCSWLLAEAQVQSTTSFQIYFDGVVGSRYFSDLAIDDVSLNPGSCQGDGACDFENGLCTWTNARDIDQCDWMIAQGSESSKYLKPDFDHTFLGGNGHYLFIDPSKLLLPGQTAVLQSQTFEATSSGCITFWYYLTGSESSTLSLIMFTVPSNISVMLWSLSGNQEDNWFFAAAPINSRNQRYQIWIQGSFTGNYFGKFAVDDIIFLSDNCAVIPEKASQAFPGTQLTTPTTKPGSAINVASTVYDCSFESGFCQWQQAVDDIFNWTRTQGPSSTQSAGPINDHTLGTGQGWFAFIAPSDTQQQNDTARLLSPQITDNTPRCLSFYYYMFGASVNLLNVYMKSSGQSHLGNLIWRRQGTQGLQWLHAKIQIKPVVSYQIIFESIPGSSYSGDIAVDDITLPTGLCEVLFLENSRIFTCDFESSSDPLCGFVQNTTDNFDWKQSNGSSGTVGSELFADHTYGTFAGHYLYAQTSLHHENDTAHLVSKMYTNPDSILHCLSFYYHMHGSNIGALNVYTMAQNQKPSAPVWKRSIDQGYQWKQAKVTIAIINKFQVIFEAVAGSSLTGYIALDDVIIIDGACQSTSSCDFEEDLCLWTNVHDSSDKFDWLRVQGSTSTQYTGPSADHTQGTISGYYIFIEINPPRQQGDNARLISQVFPASPGRAFCITFWYYLFGDEDGILSVLIVSDASHDTINSEATLWQQAGNAGKTWYSGQVNVSTVYTQKPFQVLLEGVIGSGFNGNIAVDDIAIFPGNCSTQPDTSVISGMSDLSCNFDDGTLCLWKQSKTDDFDWTVARQSTPAAGIGPDTDHTGPAYSYIYLESSRPQKIGDKADLISTVLPPTPGLGSCFSFWYHMYGPSIGALSVYTTIYGRQSLRWTRSGTQGDEWKQVQLTMISNDDYQIIMRGTVDGSQGDIAFDEVYFTDNNPCAASDGKVCDFEADMCGYTQQSSRLWWNYTTGADHSGISDHTLGSKEGHYITLSKSGGSTDVGSMLSPNFTASSGECLQFYYHLHGTNTGALKVQLHFSSGTSVIWQAQGDQGDQWKKAWVTLKTFSKYQISFDGQMGSGVGDISVDDISIQPYPCPTPGSCDFESGLCSFTNSHTDQFDWIRGFGATASHFTGPSTDHTTGTVKGYYIFIESSNNHPGDKAQLVSENLDPTPESCLVFYYNMNGAGMGSLNVYQSSNSSQKLIFNQTGHHGDVWLRGSANLTSAIPYTVIFEGVKGANYTSDIALDDISVLLGACSQQSTNTDAVTTPIPPLLLSALGCDFEIDCCQWTQDMTDKLNWTRQHASSSISSAGPRFDHTQGDSQGYFVYIEPSQHATNDSAHLRSPTFSTSGPTCATFWYHMYGIKVNQLNLYLGSPGHLGSRIWTRSGSQSFMWLYAEVEIGAVSSAQLIFEAVYGNDYEGDIALDDINVLNGSCPETPAFCDFEDRYACGFVQDTDDMFDWSLNCGSIPASASCPAGDHTYGTGQGHFMYLQTIPQQTGDEAHMLSKPYNPTYGSCLSFWYYMEGTEVGILYVYMRPEGHSLQTSTQLWSLSEDQGPYWHFATVDIESIERFQLEFVGYVVGSTESGIALDDILVMPTTCLKSADCDFEQGGICSWTQSDRDDFDWLVNSGEMGSLDSGPASDHTTGTQSGEYIYLKTSQSGGAAALVSQIISFNPDFSQYCFTFWYYMPVSPAGTLSVSWVVASAGLDSTIGMYLSGSQGNKWIQGFMDIEEDISAFTMAINGTVGSDSHDVIALDDFRLYHYNCSQVKQMTGVARHFMCNDAANTIVTQEKVCNFIRDCPPPYLDEMNCGDCSFQNGYCQWTKNSSSIWQWMLGSGQSHPGHSAPMYDPNGSPTDSFLYLTRDVGTQSAFSDIYSIVFGPCSSTCQILLFFYISGQASQVRVLLEQGEEKTVLWVTNGQDTDKWMEATVYILRVPTLFRIHIQGYTDPTSPLQSIVAVDDVQFINCNFPAPGNCDNSQSQFHCKSSACIPMAAVCDFTDDCGDGSDEVSCDTYPSRTDFEQSLGIWYNDHSGSDNFDWTRTHGLTSTTGTGPSRDHSRGTSNGYYVYIESSVPRKPGDKAWLVSSNAFNPTLGSTCVLRFYYHMFGANIGSLNVYTRLSLLGDLKQILSLTGNYGDAWMRKDVTFQETESFQIVIEGVIGNGDQGDIGIDDISMTPVCQVSTDPFPTGSPPLPTQPASCSANQFACDGNHCIPQTQVCDFQQQCNDGSDELMCGDCSFENDLCGWRDHSTGQFAWVRKSSNDSAITGGPTSDADGLVGGGQYMLVQPTMGVTQDRARLMSPVFNASGTTCHMKFKYHLFGDSAGSLMILLQKAVDIGTDAGISLWHYTGNAGNTWHLHSVDIGQIDFPFVVTFASLPDPGFGSYDVAIDSIDFEDCHPGQILNSTACYSGFCMNGGHCSVVAGVGPTCICVSNYTGFNCSTPPGLRQSNQQARNDNWKTPVGVTLGLLGVAATLGTAVYFIRRNRRSGLRFLFAFRRWHWTRRGNNITNPIFGDGVVDNDNVMQTAEDLADTASQVPQD